MNICLESQKITESLESQIFSLLKYSNPVSLILTGKSYKKLTLPQIEFLLKALGNWDANTFDVRDAVKSLENQGKIFKDEHYQFSWKIDYEDDGIDGSVEGGKKNATSPSSI